MNGELEQILQGLRELYKIQTQQLRLLNNILLALEAQKGKVESPNYKLPLEKYPLFDWDSIGASIEQVDQYGVAVVSWQGRIYQRRSPENKFKEAIWFSCAMGKNSDGSIRYERLITFQNYESPEPISRKVESLLNQA